MVVISINFSVSPAIGSGRCDFDEIRTLNHACADFAQFGRHRAQTVGFFDAPRGNIGQTRRTFGKQRGGGQGHCRIGNVVAIEFNRAQSAFIHTTNLYPIRPHHHIRAHHLQGIGEFHIALNAR